MIVEVADAIREQLSLQAGIHCVSVCLFQHNGRQLLHFKSRFAFHPRFPDNGVIFNSLIPCLIFSCILVLLSMYYRVGFTSLWCCVPQFERSKLLKTSSKAADATKNLTEVQINCTLSLKQSTYCWSLTLNFRQLKYP